MASPLSIVQQLFSHALEQGIFQSTNNPYQCINGTPVLLSESTDSNGGANATRLAAAALPQTLYFPSFVNFLFSSSALVEWAKFLIYAYLLVIVRKTLYSLYERVYDSFFITATFEEKESDESYNWVSFWLSRQPAWRNARNVQVSTDAFGFISSMLEGEVDDVAHSGTRQIAYLPANYTVHSMWYKNHRMWITRFTSGRPPIQHLRISLLARSNTILNDIIAQSKKEYEEARTNLVGVHIPSPSNDQWRIIGARPKRSVTSIILDPSMMESLIADAREFMASRTWYAARGIPFRRGYLLFGPPGSGKTSTINAIAGDLGLNVFLISLSKSGMDDSALSELIGQLPEKCIAVIEDIDAAFTHALNRESTDRPVSPNQDTNDDDDGDAPDKNNKPAPHRTGSQITLSGLLNALDGLGAQEGRLLFATTNNLKYYDALDPALCRPGRMDIHLEFRNASRYQARELFKCFYMPDLDVDVGAETGGEGAGDGSLELDGEKGRSDHGLLLSVAQVDKLAEEFADAIPERLFSMASLQGYLMGHKVTPVAAVEQAALWVAKEREERQRKKGKGNLEGVGNGADSEGRSEPSEEAVQVET